MTFRIVNICFAFAVMTAGMLWTYLGDPPADPFNAADRVVLVGLLIMLWSRK